VITHRRWSSADADGQRPTPAGRLAPVHRRAHVERVLRPRSGDGDGHDTATAAAAAAAACTGTHARPCGHSSTSGPAHHLAHQFAGTGKLTGTAVQPLVTGGIYRHSRNPQYLGYIFNLSGLAIASRSPSALALTGLLAASYAAWVPIEEEHLALLSVGEPLHHLPAADASLVGHR
jgi:hypothetical protein